MIFMIIFTRLTTVHCKMYQKSLSLEEHQIFQPTICHHHHDHLPVVEATSCISLCLTFYHYHLTYQHILCHNYNLTSKINTLYIMLSKYHKFKDTHFPLIPSHNKNYQQLRNLKTVCETQRLPT